MDEEERYWSRLERIYVHDVYESISSQYDEFLKYAKSSQQSVEHGDDGDEQPATADETKENKSEPSTTTLTPQPSLKSNAKLKKKKRAVQTRRVAHKPWPNVTNFLLQLEPYALVADIGCGDGKYLNLNKSIVTVGCDRSSSLCNLAAVKYQSACDRNQLAVCDNLALPFRSETFDAVISIGVVHHFSSPKRRIQAVKELARILRPGGKIMIYVWAMEQRVRKFNCQDVLVPMIDTKKATQPSKFLLQRNLSNNSTAYSDDSNEESDNKPVLQTRELNNNTNSSTAPDEQSAAKKLDLTFSTSSESVRTSDAEKVVVASEQTTPKQEDDKRSPSPSRTFITNVKQFLSKRFSSSNLKDIQKIKQDAGLEKTPSSKSLTDPMERYRQILEDHKDLLPKDFTIRKFPFSSCEDTFDANKSIDAPQPDEKISFDLTSGAQVVKSDDAPVVSPPPDTSSNSLNQRFYHVFKKNELDDLIKENCADLVKVSSYNDHGNWCWVGFKSD